MKKIFLFVITLVLLTSCGGPDKDAVNSARDELMSGGNIIEDTINADDKSPTKDSLLGDGAVTDKIDDKVIIDNTEKINGELIIENVKIVDLASGNSYITVNDNFPKITADTTEIKITGNVVDENVDKIVVKFSNKTSSFPNDEFQLTKFKKGNTTYEYNAAKKFQVLDTGLNEYIIEAYVGDNVTRIKVEVTIPEKGSVSANSTTDESKTTKGFGTEDNYLTIDLPENNEIGKVLNLSTNSFTYSNINGFEIEKVSPIELSCEGTSVTDFLIENYGWTYWNTCRPLNNNGISYYVLRLKGNEYFYEKHYYDSKNNLYGIKLLEKGSGVDKENIGDKNAEVKGNDYSSEIKSSDEVFNYITK